MSSMKTPTTPTKVTSQDNTFYQLATPPPTVHKKKIVQLKVDARYASIHSRRSTSTFSQLVKHPTTPKEAVAVALHPMYRGEQLDGMYYDWLLKLYDNKMPDIIRRINKFRGFPQSDNPSFNKVNAEEFKLRYATKEYQSELAQYMPYLRAYWDTCGNNFNTHLKVLDIYHELSDVDGRHEIAFGVDDDRIMGEVAKYVHALSQPPPPFDRTWKKELDDYRRDLLRSVKDKRFSDFETEPASERRSSIELLHTTASEQAGPTVSTGLLWVYHQIDVPLVSTPILYHKTATLSVPSLEPIRHLPSGVQYHSPAGDIVISRNIPDSPSFAEIKARSDIQALATEMGFVPTARLDIILQSGTQAQQQVGSSADDTLSFPMGAFRPHPKPSPYPGYGKSPNTGVVSTGTKRKRSDSDAEPAPHSTKAPKRARGDRRKGGRKGKKGKKADGDDDEDFEFQGDDLNDDEKNYEKGRFVKVGAPGTSRRSRRRRAKKASAAAHTQPKVTTEDGHTTKRGRTGKIDTAAESAPASKKARNL